MQTIIIVELTILAITLLILAIVVIALIKRVNRIEHAVGYLLYKQSKSKEFRQEEEPFEEFRGNNGKINN